MATLTDNRPTRDFEGATKQRELAQARQEAKRANEQAIANAHKLPSAAEPGVEFDRVLNQDGRRTGG